MVLRGMVLCLCAWVVSAPPALIVRAHLMGTVAELTL